MKAPLNEFLKAHVDEYEFHVAFFSKAYLPEKAESDSYLVVLDRAHDNKILLKIDGQNFAFTPIQANALGLKLLDIASADAP